MKKVIMLHGLFRSGSTYMFNKFRKGGQFWCYYEPFHHDIANLRKGALEIWKYDEKTTAGMSHPVLDRPHFYEYKEVFNDSDELVPYFDAVFSYDEFTKVSSVDGTYNYVSRLIGASPEGSMPVLQFNRSSLRIGWFRENFDHALHLFMLRNPKDQFESYLRRSTLRKNWFLAINLYIYLKNTHFFKPVALKARLFSLNLNSDSVIDNLKTTLEEVRTIPLAQHYEIFLHIWLLSLVEADKYADMIINMDEMNCSDEHMRDVKDMLNGYDESIEIGFDDFKITHYEVLSLTSSEYSEAENRVVALYEKALSENVERVATESIGSRSHCLTRISMANKIKRLKARFLLRR